MLTVLHPWHGAHYGAKAPSTVNALIEIPQGSRAKYEVDKDTGLTLPFSIPLIMDLFRKHWEKMGIRWISWYSVHSPFILSVW